MSSSDAPIKNASLSDPAVRQRFLPHIGVFLGCVILFSLLFLKPLVGVVHLSFSQPDASHLLLIPALAALLAYLERSTIFLCMKFDARRATPIFVVGLLVLGFTGSYTVGPKPDWYLSACILGLVFCWMGSFVLSFGAQTARSASFPLLFLLLFVPIPPAILDYAIYYLQWGSAEITSWLFELSGIPVLREGIVFQLPRYSIEVAKECSGIRSSMALLILTLIVAHFYLHRLRTKVAFVMIGLFVMLVKNGLRIFTLSALANYVDPRFLFGDLHRDGGVLFFVLGLLLLWPVLRLLMLSERDREPRTQRSL